MEKKNINKMSNEEYIDNAMRYFSYLPLVGVAVSIISVLSAILRGHEWSGILLLYTLIPFFGFTLLSIIVYMAIGKRLGMVYVIFKKGKKYITIFLVILLIILESLIFFVNPQFDLNFQKIYLDDIVSIETMIDKDKTDVYFIVYGASNCIHCTDMKPIYMEAFEQTKTINTFCCDISHESYVDERLIELNVDKIPVIVSYKNNKEIGRLEGAVDIETIITFIQSYKN